MQLHRQECLCYRGRAEARHLHKKRRNLLRSRWKRDLSMARSADEGVRFLPASDQSLMVYFGERISLEANARVVKFLRLLEREPIPAVRNLHPGYASVLVKFDALRSTHAEMERA